MRRRTPPRAEHKEIIALEHEQAAAVIRTVAGSRIYIPALLALPLTAGMRHGERCAWADQARLLDRIVATLESFALKRESSGP